MQIYLYNRCMYIQSISVCYHSYYMLLVTVVCTFSQLAFATIRRLEIIPNLGFHRLMIIVLPKFTIQHPHQHQDNCIET